jgi:hypothetical protein
LNGNCEPFFASVTAQSRLLRTAFVDPQELDFTRNEIHSLQEATRQFIDGLAHSNPSLPWTGGLQNTTLSGRGGLVATLTMVEYCVARFVRTIAPVSNGTSSRSIARYACRPRWRLTPPVRRVRSGCPADRIGIQKSGLTDFEARLLFLGFERNLGHFWIGEDSASGTSDILPASQSDCRDLPAVPVLARAALAAVGDGRPPCVPLS